MAAIAATTTAGRVRAVRRVHELPQPGAARQAGGDDRRDQRRAVHPRPRRRLERDRVPGLRLPVRPPRGPLRGGVHDHPHAPWRGRHRFRRALLPGARLRAAAAQRPSRRPAPAHRLQRAADAADRAAARDAWNTWYADIGNTPAGIAPLRDGRGRGVPRRRTRSGGDRADRRRAGRPARRHGPAVGRRDPGRDPAADRRPGRHGRWRSARTPAKGSARSSWSSTRSPCRRSRRSRRR